MPVVGAHQGAARAAARHPRPAPRALAAEPRRADTAPGTAASARGDAAWLAQRDRRGARLRRRLRVLHAARRAWVERRLPRPAASSRRGRTLDLDDLRPDRARSATTRVQWVDYRRQGVRARARSAAAPAGRRAASWRLIALGRRSSWPFSAVAAAALPRWSRATGYRLPGGTARLRSRREHRRAGAGSPATAGRPEPGVRPARRSSAWTFSASCGGIGSWPR